MQIINILPYYFRAGQLYPPLRQDRFKFGFLRQ